MSRVPGCLILPFPIKKSATEINSDQDENKWLSLHLLVGPPCDTTDDLIVREFYNEGLPRLELELGRQLHVERQGPPQKTRSVVAKVTHSKENPCISLF